MVFDSRGMRDASAVFDADAIRGAHVECFLFVFFKYANLRAETKNMRHMKNEASIRSKEKRQMALQLAAGKVARETDGSLQDVRRHLANVDFVLHTRLMM